jgi:hypothetical protein
MADTLPLNFPIPKSGSIATYSYTDIAEGTGVVQFNLSTHQEEAVVGYFMTTNTIGANDLSSSVATTAGGFTKDGDFDFDVVFNNFQKIKGKAYAEFEWGQNHNNTGAGQTSYIILRIRKYDGSTETEIASAQSESISVGVLASMSQRSTLLMNIPSRVSFSKGDILRLTVEVWTNDNTGLGTVIVAHDPKNREVATGSIGGSTSTTFSESTFKLFVPFELDL